MSLILPRQQALVAAKSPPLKTIAAANGILFGSTLTGFGSIGSDRYGEVFAREIGQATVEFQSGFDTLQPTETNFSFTAMDAVVTYFKGLGVPINGGNILGHSAFVIPTWLTSKLTTTPADWDDAIDDHLSAVMQHTDTGIDYTADIDDWMIVNEAFLESDANGVFRESVWYTAADDGGNGYDYIPYAYQQAATYAPNARLILNQNQLDVATASTRQANMLTWLETWIAASVPIHAVGMQCHIQHGSQFVGADLRSFIRNVHALGLDCIITEFDTRSSGSGSDWKQLQEMADYAKRFLDVCFEEGVSELTAWGIVGDHWWLSASTDVSGVFYGDAPYRPTPVRSATVQAMQIRPWHPLDLSVAYEIFHMGLSRGTWRADPSGTTMTGLIPEALAALQAAEPGEDYFLVSIEGMLGTNTLVSPAATNEPRYVASINGVPTVDFDGSNDRMEASTGPGLTEPYGACLTGLILTADTNDRRMLSGQTNLERLVINTSGASNFYGMHDGTTSSTSADTTNPRIITAIRAAASSYLQLENTQIASGSASTRPMNELAIGGNNGGGNNAHYRFQSLYIDDGEISAADSARRVAFEQAFWGLS